MDENVETTDATYDAKKRRVATLWLDVEDLVRNRDSRRVRNKRAVRFFTYWTLGIVLTLLINVCIHGVQPGVWPVFFAILLALIVAGSVYWRWTDSHERKRDLVRKMTDPFWGLLSFAFELMGD